MALLLPATAAWWAAALWRVQAVHPRLPLPVAALTLEAAALLAVTAALAAAGSHLAPERRGGVVAAPALLALTSAAFLLPAQVTLYAQPGSAAWDGAHQRWAILLGLALVTFALASRDPAHRRLPSQLRGSLTGSPAAGPPERRPGAQGRLTLLVGWNGRSSEQEERRTVMRGGRSGCWGPAALPAAIEKHPSARERYSPSR